ncbi:MAG: chemotaxis protein CheA, partial [Nitrospira sp.]|nr:chemotaxis protein CheA [Nitrospira sp.]
PILLDDPSLQTSSQRLSLITSELQEGIMKTRMQPIGNIFGKFPRVVRDLALACGKQIRIEMEGKGTELDKTLIEAIKDPLTHLVRNSVDHGIEAPDVREARGKSREGVLLLRAYHEGGQVNIEITDDGGGINTQRVAETAIKRGVVTGEQVSKMSERELLNLIFLPGFSTAAKVTNVSGRGVGMDVVKTNIEKIGGTIDIQTKLEKGTTFKLKVPLTLAIIPALIITTGEERFAIPQVSLLELVRLEGEQIKKYIDSLHGTSVCRLRGQLLPLLYLNQIVGLSSKHAMAVMNEEHEEVVNIVVLQADGQRFGLVVDEINDTEEIVVKPLSKQLKGIPVFAGATIMGDGRVALILDVLGLANRAGMAIPQGDASRSDLSDSLKAGQGQRQTLL